MTSQKRILVTAALPYVNNLPHLGNLIGSTLSADVYVRYLRSLNHNVLYVCGTDEYGTTTIVKAKDENMECLELCTKYHNLQKEVYKWFNIGFDVFGRTTTQTQTELTHEIFKELWTKGMIEERECEQMYCKPCSHYLVDRNILGICYNIECKNNNIETNGDQCDKCGLVIDPCKLINPQCKTCKSIPEKQKSMHLFFKLGAFQQQLHTHMIKDQKTTMTANAYSITEGLLKANLESRCITRDLHWGTPVPIIDPKLEIYKDKVFHVWFDAPIGYFSILKHGREDWKDWFTKTDSFVNFFGKDNTQFHTLLFPATLMGAELGFPIVDKVFCTDYLQYEGEKFSKTKGIGIFGDNVIDMSTKLNITEDYWRFYLCKIRPETADSNFSWKEFIAVVNADLVNNLGNFINRCVSMTTKYCKSIAVGNLAQFPEIILQISKLITDYNKQMSDSQFRRAINIILTLGHLGNTFLQTMKPWANKNTSEVNNILSIGNFIAFVLMSMLEPFIPKTSAMLLSSYEVRINDLKIDSLLKYSELIINEKMSFECLIHNDKYKLPFRQLEVKI